MMVSSRENSHSGQDVLAQKFLGFSERDYAFAVFSSPSPGQRF